MQRLQRGEVVGLLLPRDPFTVIAVGHATSDEVLQRAAEVFGDYLETILTVHTLQFMQQNPNFDVASVLGDEETRVLDEIVQRLAAHPSLLWGRVMCFPLPKPMRRHVQDAIREALVGAQYEYRKSSSRRWSFWGAARTARAATPGPPFLGCVLFMGPYLVAECWTSANNAIDVYDVVLVGHMVRSRPGLRRQSSTFPVGLPRTRQKHASSSPDVAPGMMAHCFCRYIHPEVDMFALVFSREPELSASASVADQIRAALHVDLGGGTGHWRGGYRNQNDVAQRTVWSTLILTWGEGVKMTVPVLGSCRLGAVIHGAGGVVSEDQDDSRALVRLRLRQTMSDTVSEGIFRLNEDTSLSNIPGTCRSETALWHFLLVHDRHVVQASFVPHFYEGLERIRVMETYSHILSHMQEGEEIPPTKGIVLNTVDGVYCGVTCKNRFFKLVCLLRPSFPEDEAIRYEEEMATFDVSIIIKYLTRTL